MGYYTRYKLKVVSGKDPNIDYEEEIGKASEYGGGDLFEEEIKWYECDTDMKNFSKAHPDTLFQIDGEGEESGDIWRAYYKNGKSFRVQAKMTFEEFSEEKLR